MKKLLIASFILGLLFCNSSFAWCDFGDTNCQRFEDQQRYERNKSTMESLRHSNDTPSFQHSQDELQRSIDRLHSY